MSREDQNIPQIDAPLAKWRSKIWVWLVLAAAVAVVGFLRFGYEFGGEAIGPRHPAVGRRLPGLQLQALTGDVKDISLNDLAGKVAVINFWGTWCPPCIAEFPELAALWAQFRDQPNFQMVSVSCENEPTSIGKLRVETIMFLVKKESQLPTYADEGLETRRNVAMVLGEDGFGYPTTLVLDQSGVIRGVWVGFSPGIGGKIKELVEELLKK